MQVFFCCIACDIKGWVHSGYWSGRPFTIGGEGLPICGGSKGYGRPIDVTLLGTMSGPLGGVEGCWGVWSCGGSQMAQTGNPNLLLRRHGMWGVGCDGYQVCTNLQPFV